MSQIPAGWYDDPQPAYGHARLRWWDGQRWTEHTSAHPSATSGVPSTPDGEALAGWGRRLGALVIDGAILVIVNLVLGFPLLSRILSAYGDYFHDAMRAAESGAQPPSQFGIYHAILWPMLGLQALALVLNLVYEVLFLRWKAATPGKLMLGMRIRLRERQGPLSWGTVLRRWVGQFGPNVLGLVPFVGSIASVYNLVDGLWPLGDKNRQALHDKLAHTNVVMVRPSPDPAAG